MSYELNINIEVSFPDVCVDKGLAAKAGLSGRSLPVFVSDWLVSRYRTDNGVDSSAIRQFVARHLPDKKQKEALMYELRNGAQLKILDSYSVTVHPSTGDLVLRIPSLDVSNGRVVDAVVDDNPLLLMGNVWGSGSLNWRPMKNSEDKYEIVMTDFRPMQSSSIDIDFFIKQRSKFSVEDWISMLIRTMGYSEHGYSQRQKLLMLTRLIPLVEPRVNFIELAPKGTGKSFVYSQLSRHSWLISGGVVTRAQLFFDMSKQRTGIISRFDAVIFDEIQTIRLADEGQIIGALKGYLESGEYRVMGFHGTSEAGLVILGNIPIEEGIPRDDNLFWELPRWLKGVGATALLDRFHGLIPGWELPRIQSSFICQDVALRADYFSEVLHSLRMKNEFMGFVKDCTEIDGDIRDKNAVQRLACGYLKLFFPDLSMVTKEQYRELCLLPAIQLRSNIRRQLSIMDAEFSPDIAHVNLV